LASEKRFQHTKEHTIWIPYAKVMRIKVFLVEVQKLLLPHRYAHIDFEDVPKE